MDSRYERITAIASTQFGAVSLEQLIGSGVDHNLRRWWCEQGLIARLGPRSYAIVGSDPSWHQRVWAAGADIAGAGYVAGRSAARLHGLDGFSGNEVELLVRRVNRNVKTPHRVSSTSLPLGRGDTTVVDAIRCLTVERLILDAPLFGFDRAEIEIAIDSAIRLRKVGEQRLRTQVVARHRRSINNGRVLLDALVDTGGESRLERWFLGIVRAAGLPRPLLQQIQRDGQRTVARLDALFDGGLIVEVSGHGTHASRRDRQRDEQRRTELTLRGLRVLTFTYEDIRDRPEWVIARLLEAFALAAA